MLTKLYKLAWLAVAIAAIAVYVAGAFTMFMGVIFGFICFGMVFAGMMCVLPSTVAHPQQAVKETRHPAVPHIKTQSTGVVERFRAFKSAWMSNGVEIGKPKYR